jgi:hypothetical protein
LLYALKGVVYAYMSPPLDSSRIGPSTVRDMATVSKMSSMIVVALPKLRVLLQNPPVRSAPTKANRARDKVTQRVASS